MFADDANLYFLHHDIKTLFDTVNNELSKIRQWFIANRLSLNAKKAKYTFFHKNSSKDDIPLLNIPFPTEDQKSEMTF